MTRPLVLDLFCCAGGASWGYHLAGFDVVGVDIAPQPNYPFPFARADAMDTLSRLLDGGTITVERRVFRLTDFVAVHTSPPCQASSALTKGTNKGREYPQLIPETRRLLAATGLPTVLENVQGADVRRDLTLCGEMFELGVIRHRYFELGGGLFVPQPEHVPHRGRVRGWRHGTYHDGPYVAVYGDGGGKGSVAEWRNAMGIHWTNVRAEIAEAIPPAYTRHVGEHLMNLVRLAA